MAEPPKVSLEKLVETYRQVSAFYKGMEATTAKYQTEDKGHCALAAVGLTVRLLMNLKVSREMLAPLMEAGQIIERTMKVRTGEDQRKERDVWDSAVVSLLHADGMSINEALKMVVGRDPSAVETLRTFRKRLTRSSGPRKERDLYYELKREFKQRFPSDTGNRALKASHAMRGKSVAKV